MVNESRKQYVCDWCSYYDENNIENKVFLIKKNTLKLIYLVILFL